MINLDIICQKILVCQSKFTKFIAVDCKVWTRSNRVGVHDMHEKLQPACALSAFRACQESAEAFLPRGQASAFFEVCDSAQLVDNQLISVNKILLKICHFIQS